MRLLTATAIAWAVIAWMAGPTSRSSLAAETQCEAVDARIVHDNDLDARIGCDGAAAAVRFMAGLGLKTDTPIHIQIKPLITLRAEGSYSLAAHGQYNAATNEIHIVAFDHSSRPEQRRTAFGLPLDEQLQRSFIIHEVTHAVAQQNFAAARPPRVSHEYIAYVAQISTLPEALRTRILARYQTEGFADDSAISPILYEINPDMFAIKSYLHFNRSENGTLFLRRVLIGDFRPTPWF